MRSRAPLLVLAVLLRIGSPAAADDRAPERENLAWDCERLEVVTSREGVESLRLFLPDRTLKLPLVPSASGERYQGEGVMFWTKGGDQALLERDGEVFRCSVDGRRTVWEDARLRGVDFRAVGNEPGWLLEIGPERMVFLYDYATRRAEAARPEPVVDAEAGRTVYATEVDAWPFTVTLLGKPCRDTMSDEAFETTVTVEWGPNRYLGCGRSLH
jgi:putative lipoprotein